MSEAVRPDDHVHSTNEPPFTKREAKQARRLGFVLTLISVFFVIEIAGAFAARSNVLKADALHLLMDVLALSMSLLAMRIAVRRPTARFTFGLRRAEPVAAIVNGTLVLLATFEIVRRAIISLQGQETPESGLMLAIAGFALVVNGISAWVLHGAIGHHGHAHGHDHGHDHDHGKGHDLNVRGARLHLLGDTLGSVAALAAALTIRFGGPVAADPIASLLVAAILVLGAGRLLRDAALVLLEAAPPHLPVNVVREVIRGFEGVTGVHDMHVWSLGAGHDAIAVHVVAIKNDGHLGARLAAHLREKFKVEYVTVQVERDDACDAPSSRFEER
jgi:cation diffusion facilitator family transporter